MLCPVDGSVLGNVVDHRRAQPIRFVVGRTVHQVAVEDEQISRSHRHRHRCRGIVVDDLDVAVVRIGAAVRNVLLYRSLLESIDEVAKARRGSQEQVESRR